MNWMIRSAAAAIVLAGAAPASATITTSRITTPAGPTFALYDANTPNTFAVAGTTDSTAPATDKVDIDCFYDSGRSSGVATGVSLASNGSFSIPAASLHAITNSECRLRAMPAGITTNDPGFAGPLMHVGERQTKQISGGPNDTTAYDFYIYGQQRTAADDYDSLGGCGLDDSYLFDASYSLSTVVFFCNAAAFSGNLDGTSDTRSEIQVDGHDAYASGAAQRLFFRSGACPPHCDGSQDNPGFPALTYNVTQNASNGNLRIAEADAIVRCTAPGTYPPTSARCPGFARTGVTLVRTVVQIDDGHVVTISDRYISTDGHPHAIDLLYQNDQALTAGGHGFPAHIGYRFPGQASYAAHLRGATVTVPAGPGTIYVKDLTADDGDPFTGQGAITYSAAPTQILFVNQPTVNSSDFTMHYAGTVPATGALSYSFAYSTEYTTLGVAADALPLEDALGAPAVSISSPHSGARVSRRRIRVSGTATDNVAVASLRIDGKPVALGAGGAWRTTVTLHRGANTIAATATDAAGNATTANVKVTYRPICLVPVLRGRTLAAAKRALRAAHCGVGKIGHAHSSNVGAGRVISSKPGAGATRPSGTKIKLLISLGP